MPTISPSVIPTVAAGSLFSQLTTNATYNIRWLSPTEPVFFEVFNRPHADIAVRQLIIAKAVDNLQVRLGHQNLFPFIIQPQIDLGSSREDVPIALIWDLHASLPKKWEWIRLAKVKRISGSNPATSGTAGDYTGMLRFIFTGQEVGSSTEVAIFMADYHIDSILDFQIQNVEVVTAAEEATAIGSGESETVAGQIIFRTLDVEDPVIQQFLDTVAPPTPGSEDSEGFFVSPAVYEVADSDAGGASIANDFSAAVFTHGTGMLTASAVNKIPSLDSDINTWINTFNFPFRSDVSRISSGPIAVTIPKGLFEEFNMITPDADRPSDDNTGNYFPVWISKVIRDDAGADNIRVIFATFNTSDIPSTSPIDFAQLSLSRDGAPGDILAIEPINDLYPLITDTVLSELFEQGFGRGHVRLSTKWGITGGEVSSFFDSLIPVVGDDVEFTFPMSTTALSPLALSRVPKNTPTNGQAQALIGTTSDLADPKHPSSTNRFVVEKDQGLGDQIDFALPETGLPEELRNNPDIGQFGHTGALTHRVVKLEINSSTGSLDYNTDILPRLVILLGRQPQFADFWYDGTKLKFFNGDTWQT